MSGYAPAQVVNRNPTGLDCQSAERSGAVEDKVTAPTLRRSEEHFSAQMAVEVLRPAINSPNIWGRLAAAMKAASDRSARPAPSTILVER